MRYAILATFSLLVACQPAEWEELPTPTLEAGHDYTPELPAQFRTPTMERFDNTPARNPTTDAGAELGRVLFWDRRLSANGETSCGSCHDPAIGFSDESTHSIGFEGGETRRHSMQLINLRWYARRAMFWDERADSLEEQVLMPIVDETEMGLSLGELVDRLTATDFYGPLFEAAFGDPEVTEDRISRALAQFVRSIVSHGSRWDEGVALVDGDIARDFPNFTSEENRGKDLFFGQHDPSTRGLCGTCHLMNNPLAFVPGGGSPPGIELNNTAVFFMIAPANNGLLDETDDGLAEVTGDAGDAGAFKSPSLRNIAQTAPYMHDGRFATLEEVVEHYDSGIEAHPNLDPALREVGPGGGPLRLNLTAADRAALVAFLRTLTDETLATDPRFSDPFAY